MADKTHITLEEHRKQIERYTAVYPCYKEFASILKRVLEDACKTSFPEAFIQSRPKSISSFAEKAAPQAR